MVSCTYSLVDNVVLFLKVGLAIRRQLSRTGHHTFLTVLYGTSS